MKRYLFPLALCGLMALVAAPSVSAEVDSTPSQKKEREGKRHDAYSFLYGLGVEQNIPYGLELMEKDAMAGFAPASCLLGIYHIYGSFGLDDPAKGVEWLQRGARDGSAAAMGMLTICYMSGHGVEQDLDKAFRLAELAAGRGEAVGFSALGWMYSKGIGTERDEVAAASSYMRAALQGKEDCMYRLGLCYAKGHGVPHLLGTGEEWLKRASACGSKAADFALEAISLARSTKAVPESELGSLSAEECYAQAVYRLYREGNRYSAKPFLQRAADLGYGVAVALQAGEQMAPNLPETERKALLDRLSAAAEAGCAHAVLVLSAFYGGVGGGGMDREELRKWTLRSAELGHGPAADTIGLWYFYAAGSPKPDLEKALLWYRKAVDLGYPGAKAHVEMVEKMFRLKSGQDVDP